MKSTRKKSQSRSKPKLSNRTKSSRRRKATKKRTEAARETRPKVWRDASGRFASPVYFDGKRYRSKTTGAVAKFATTSSKPSKAAKVAKKAGKPVSLKPKGKAFKKAAKPVSLKPKGKPSKKPRKPVIAKPRKPKAPKKPEAPPTLPKTPLPQLFGKNRRETLVPIVGEIQDRLVEAEALVAQVQGRGLKASSISEVGYEYYQLIAAIEKMSPHDIYTLFMSP